MRVGYTTTGTDTDERTQFIAAALTLGFELADNTPCVSNVYSIDRTFEPGQPGDVRYFLATHSRGIPIQEIAAIWRNHDGPLESAKAFPGRILTIADNQSHCEVVTAFDDVYQHSALVYMRRYGLSRVYVSDPHNLHNEERQALEVLDGFAKVIDNARDQKSREAACRLLAQHWKPAMCGWVKAFVANMLELRNLWQEAPAAIKIQRDNLPPLVIPKGPKFKELLKRWT